MHRAEIRLHLDGNGDPAAIEADGRPRMVGRLMQPTPWFGRCSDYAWQGGRRIPTRAEAGWRLEGGPFVYWRGRIESWSVA
ncbi:MAG TPA: DUF6544 family protein [Stellaceae bacterium]|nr:DUF6544 family protein [Stellaceae bacterium]